MEANLSTENINHLVVNANRLTSLISNLQFAVLLENEKREIVLVNQKFCDLFNIPVQPDLLIGADCSQAAEQSKHLFSDPEFFVKDINSLLEKKEKKLQEKLVKKDGSVLLRDFIPIWSNAVYQGHLWVYNDITEKIKSEDLLKNQREFYEEILNQIPADIAVFSTNHEYLFVNPMGIKDPVLRSWIIGKRDEDYFALKNKPISLGEGRRKLFNDVVQSKLQQEWIETIKTLDGSEEYHLRKMYPVIGEDEVVKLVIGYGINITQQKRNENIIRSNEKRYRDLFNFSPALIFTQSVDGEILSANQTAEHLLGYTPSDINGKHISQFFEGGKESPAYLFFLDEMKANRQVKGVVPVVTKSGSIVHLLCHAFLVEEDQETPYIIVFAQDISDRIIAEENLLEAKRLSEETAATKSAFMARVSHEIRTPMNGILGIADLLSKTGLNEQQQKYTSIILDSAKNLLATINDVLEIEKIVSGKMPIKKIAFNFSEKITAIADSYKLQAIEKGIRFEMINNIPASYSFLGDPFKITQILNNLLANANKFTEVGEIIFELSIVNKEADAAEILMRVKDTGIGIPENKLQEIFEPFAQAHFISDPSLKGTGLGLTICKELVELMEGSITAISEINKGAEFRVQLKLPFAKELDKGPEATTGNKMLLAGKHILIAEDHKLNQFLIREIADKWHLHLDIAENGSLAVEMATKNHYDLILMDIQMPVMNGIEASKAIRSLADPIKNSVPIIALTANIFSTDTEEYLSVGINDHIAKPFVEEVLFQGICKNLNLSTTATEIIEVVENDSTLPEVDLSYLKSIAGVNNTEVLKKMIHSFQETTKELGQEFEEIIQSKQYGDLAALAHKFKFSIHTMGVHVFKKEIIQIEETAAKGKITEDLLNRFSVIKEQMIKLANHDFN